MQIAIEFEERRIDFTAGEVARFFCDMQHFALFALALAEADLRSEVDLFDHQFSKYEFMILADSPFIPNGPYLQDIVLFVKEISLQSPLKALFGMLHTLASKQRLASVLDSLRGILMLEVFKERALLENERIRQQTLSEALANYETALRIAARIRDKKRRAEFESNLSSAITPFLDGRYPPLREIRIIDPGANTPVRDPPNG